MSATFKYDEHEVENVTRGRIYSRGFLRYLFARELSFTFCDFGIAPAFLIISTVVIHHMLTLISLVNLL